MELDFKGTPGNWEMKEFPDGRDCFVEAPNPGARHGIEILMDDYGPQNHYPYEQKKADAILISAAPDMFQALKRLLMWAIENNHPEVKYAFREAKKALRKATGQEVENG